MDASRGFFCLRGGLPTSSSSGATAGKGLATPVRSFVSANSRQTTIFPRIAIVSKQQPSLSLVIRFSRSRIARGRGVGCAYDGSLMLFFPPKTPSSIEPPTSPPLQLRCGKPPFWALPRPRYRLPTSHRRDIRRMGFWRSQNFERFGPSKCETLGQKQFRGNKVFLPKAFCVFAEREFFPPHRTRCRLGYCLIVNLSSDKRHFWTLFPKITSFWSVMFSSLYLLISFSFASPAIPKIYKKNLFYNCSLCENLISCCFSLFHFRKQNVVTFCPRRNTFCRGL